MSPALILHLPETCPALPGLRNEGQARPRVGAVRASLRTTLWRSHFRAGRSERASATRPPLGWVGLGPVLVAPCGGRAASRKRAGGAFQPRAGGALVSGEGWGRRGYGFGKGLGVGSNGGNRISGGFPVTGDPNAIAPLALGGGQGGGSGDGPAIASGERTRPRHLRNRQTSPAPVRPRLLSPTGARG